MTEPEVAYSDATNIEKLAISAWMNDKYHQWRNGGPLVP